MGDGRQSTIEVLLPRNHMNHSKIIKRDVGARADQSSSGPRIEQALLLKKVRFRKKRFVDSLIRSGKEWLVRFTVLFSSS